MAARSGVAFWIRDVTRPTNWPFIAGFGIVNFLAWKYLKFPDNLPDRKDSLYAQQQDNWGKPAAHGHGHAAHKH